MKKAALALTACFALMAQAAAFAADAYSIKTNGDVVQLRDETADVTVSVLTPVSNAYEMVVKGQNVIRMTIRSVDDMRARPNLNGVPLMSPFANRLDQTAFYANGKKYNFDTEFGNIRAPVPIHGYLTGASAWKVVEAKSDATGAWVTSKIDFYKIPAYMHQFPFAHTLTMTYKLSGGALEVKTRIDNLSDDPMPVSIGFHPYFSLTDSNRNDWRLNVPAKTHWLLDDRSIPTGQTEPATTFWGGDTKNIPLSRFATKRIDDVFSDLDRDAEGRATATMRGKRQQIAVTLGPKYKTLLVFSQVPPAPNAPPAAPGGGGGGGGANAAPPPPPVSTGPAIPLSAKDPTPTPASRGFVAFEPMVAITNAMNLAQKGAYNELQSVAPGGSWEESFWIKATGY